MHLKEKKIIENIIQTKIKNIYLYHKPDIDYFNFTF